MLRERFSLSSLSKKPPQVYQNTVREEMDTPANKAEEEKEEEVEHVPAFLAGSEGMTSSECFFEELYKQNLGELKVYNDRC